MTPSVLSSVSSTPETARVEIAVPEVNDLQKFLRSPDGKLVVSVGVKADGFQDAELIACEPLGLEQAGELWNVDHSVLQEERSVRRATKRVEAVLLCRLDYGAVHGVSRVNVAKVGRPPYTTLELHRVKCPVLGQMLYVQEVKDSS